MPQLGLVPHFKHTKMKQIIQLFGLILLLNSCDNIQVTRPATGKKITTPVTPVGPVFSNPNCNPGVNQSVCSGLLNFNIDFGTSNPDITLVNDKLTVTYTNNQFDRMIITLSPFVPENSNNFYICSSPSSVKNYNVYLQLIGNSLGSTKLTANSNGSEILHVKYNQWNSSYNLVFCDAEFKYTFNSSNSLKLITGRFDFIY